MFSYGGDLTHLSPALPLCCCSCAGQTSCASTYDDRPAHFAAPWEFTGSAAGAQQELLKALEQLGASIQQQQPGYIYATFSSQLLGVYDTEFAFGDNDNVVSEIRLA
jgi:uncharacterized protein (DUF1499 family)